MPATYSHIIPFRPVPNYPIKPCKHYREHRRELETMDDILTRSGLDDFMLHQALKRRREQSEDEKSYSRGLEAFIAYARMSFRVSILRALTQLKSVREMEISLGSNALEQWFCFIPNFDQVKSPSKSSIDRAKNFFTEEDMQAAFRMLLEKAASSPENYDPVLESAMNAIGFEMPVNLLEVWYDSTCMSPNIHFPTDWVQLGDCCRSLLKTIGTIRTHGILNRMPAGATTALLSDLNQLLIAFGNARRRKDSRKLRKKILRELKRFSNRCAYHAKRHKELLEANREEKTDLTEAQAALLIGRLDKILTTLPIIKKQAHDRIIGGRRIKPNEKVLSAYESDINVLVRGKSGAEVEFGNQLMIGENRDGLITFYELYDDVKNDWNRLEGALEKTEWNIGNKLKLVVGDRGFSEVKTETRIAKNSPYLTNHIFPKPTKLHREKRKDPEFVRSQKRRAQTEARIAILTNNYQRGRSLSKGIASQRMELHWVMLAHNLRVLAQKRLAEERARSLDREQAA